MVAVATRRNGKTVLTYMDFAMIFFHTVLLIFPWVAIIVVNLPQRHWDWEADRSRC
jgi:hypothetical protein